jgi:dihydrofolate synthase / folylpolyglutamate synthase
MRSAVEWIESLRPWPADGFGLERMRALLAALGDPQLVFPAVHVVGTNGKGTTTRTVEETLTREGLLVGGYYSPHVTGWAERIRLGGEEADFEEAVGAIRAEAEVLEATQFEALTAAALLAFADAGVDAAAVEAGLGGRYDATNVLRSRVVVLTNVALEHTEVLGDTREAIAREKLAVVQPGSIVVLGEAEWEAIAAEHDPARIVGVAPNDDTALGGVAASEFLGREVDPEEVSLPGRLEIRGDEIRDGAHTPEAVRYIAPQLPAIGTIVASVLEDKDVDGVLRELAKLAPVLVATSSSHPRALPADVLAQRAANHFDTVETAPNPNDAIARAHELGSPVLVTGSLYLLADVSKAEEQSVPCRNSVNG